MMWKNKVKLGKSLFHIEKGIKRCLFILITVKNAAAISIFWWV